MPSSAEEAFTTNKKNSVEEKPIEDWTETDVGAESFAFAVGGAIRFLVVGNREKLPLKKIYWKPGAPLQSIFARAGEFAAVSIAADPVELDFRALTESVFVFEYTGSFDIEESESLRIPISIKTLSFFSGKTFFAISPNYIVLTLAQDYKAANV